MPPPARPLNAIQTHLIVFVDFSKAPGFIVGEADASHTNGNRNIKWGGPSNIEYKWAYFTRRSCANPCTHSSRRNKSFPFRQPRLLGHCLILSAVKGRGGCVNKWVYSEKIKTKQKREGWGWWLRQLGNNTTCWWKIESAWLIDDNEPADKTTRHGQCQGGLVLRRENGEKSQVSSKWSRVRFSLFRRAF